MQLSWHYNIFWLGHGLCPIGPCFLLLLAASQGGRGPDVEGDRKLPLALVDAGLSGGEHLVLLHLACVPEEGLHHHYDQLKVGQLHFFMSPCEDIKERKKPSPNLAILDFPARIPSLNSLLIRIIALGSKWHCYRPTASPSWRGPGWAWWGASVPGPGRDARGRSSSRRPPPSASPHTASELLC